MSRRLKALISMLISGSTAVWAQADSSSERLARMVELSEVLARSGMNVARFTEQVKNDTRFYKAFYGMPAPSVVR